MKVQIVFQPEFFYNRKTGKVAYSKEPIPGWSHFKVVTWRMTVKDLIAKNPEAKKLLLYSTDGYFSTRGILIDGTEVETMAVKEENRTSKRSPNEKLVQQTKDRIFDIVEKCRSGKKNLIIHDNLKMYDTGADSLDRVEIIAEIEKEFNLAISDEHAEKLMRSTIGELVMHVISECANLLEENEVYSENTQVTQSSQ